MKKIFFSLAVALFFSFSANVSAQINQGGTPTSYLKADLLKTVSFASMEYVNVAQLRNEDLTNDTIKSIPWRFGQNLYVDLSPQNSGVWDTLDNGTKIWRLGIRSAGALSINLTFDKYVLPPGATLFVYNSTHSELIGAFTDFNNQADSIFATTLVRGDSITIEYNEPANVSFPAIIHLWRVTHGYRDAFEYAKSFGSSGSCQINVACTATSAGWENEIRSVCMLVSGGSGFCTGSLVNNTANDGTPYVLTANHCYSAPGSWVFWFNWQSSTCTNPSSSPSYNSITGATLKARTTTSDFCLVQINSAIPSNFNVFYNGWNRTTTAPTSGMGIHHPAGDIKKISPAGQFVNYGSYDAGNGAADCWQVPWSGTACTEGGSSGSPIYDNNHLVVGQLYGGPSACGASAANMNDFYGKFCTSWTGDGTNTTRLSNWLDPSSISPTTLSGYDPNGPAAPVADYTASPTTSCTGVIQFTDASTGSPTSWAWTFGDGGTSTLQSPSHTYTVSGTYTVRLIATSTVSSDTMTKVNYITINLPTAPTTTDGSRCGTGTVSLSAAGTGTLNWYDAETAGNLVNSGTSYTTPSLSTTTTYYVENHIIQASQYVGPLTTFAAGSYSATSYTLNFNCLSPCTLVSVAVDKQTAGSITIQLTTSTGTVLQTGTFTVAAGASRVTLNWPLTVATGLKLVGPANAGLWRVNTAGTFPYTLTGLVSITSCSSTTRFGSFFNWEIKEPDCISSRIPVTATINTAVAASVSIAASPTGAICSGTSVTFTANATNGGTTPAYQWKKNAANITGATNSTYTSSTLAQSDAIACEMTSNASCVSGSPATSNAITMTVNAGGAASVSIAANPVGAICSGTSITFTATPTNGGTATYQWKLNGANISGATNSTFTSATLANSDAISCVMTSSLSCATGSPATSNTLTMTVNAPATASVNISASPSTTICTGTEVDFIATPTNGGTAPSYQWQVNGTNVGSDVPAYASTTLGNGDVITCIMTSNATCVSASPATSNALTISISGSLPASVSISASPSTATCLGTIITFTATTANGGNTPAYQWKVNGANVGTSISTYSSSSLVTGDMVTCVMTSSSTCATGSPATSNALTVTISSSMTASVLISATPGVNICSGTNVTFTATAYNGGTPSYQWKLNGTDVGSNSSAYVNNSLADNDVINCLMTSSESCATNNPATSNSLTVHLTTALPVSISIAANPSGSICSGTPITYTATATNGGTAPVYHWQLNGANVGSNSSTYTSSTLSNGDIVICLLISSATCTTGSPATSNAITASVNITPATPVITQNGDTLISSVATGNQWYYQNALGSFPISGATNQTYVALVTGDYYSIVSGQGGCESDTSNIMNMVIVGLAETETASVLIYPNPVSNMLYIEFTQALNGNTELELLNGIGQLLHKESLENISGHLMKTINMSTYTKGLYFLRIKNTHSIRTEKLIVD